MGIINVLDKHTANLIAAGEVVERPSSAIKELLENCADAGATQITVEIKNGGSSYIRVSDNGCGIAAEDVPVCIMRHATSKIRTKEDLSAISTLGFRGEALAAIAAVTRLRILTKRREDAVGTSFAANFGEKVEISETGCPNGTTIIAENLFENVPARRKFLRKDVTEAKAVGAAVEKFALSKPHIAITFISDGSVRLKTPGDGNLKSSIYAAIGREFSDHMLPVDYTLGNVTVTGFIGKPEICRPNRNLQNFFINERYIRSGTMTAGLEEGFKSFCPIGKFPACVLFVKIDFSLVDINIHPAKLEVKFSDERPVFEAVMYAVRNALSRGMKSFAPGDEEGFSQYTPPKAARDPVDFEKKPSGVSINGVGEETDVFDAARRRPPEVTSDKGTVSLPDDKGVELLFGKKRGFDERTFDYSVPDYAKAPNASEVSAVGNASTTAATASKKPSELSAQETVLDSLSATAAPSQEGKESSPKDDAEIVLEALRRAEAIYGKKTDTEDKKAEASPPLSSSDGSTALSDKPDDAKQKYSAEELSLFESMPRKVDTVPERPFKETSDEATGEALMKRVTKGVTVIGEAFNSYIIVERDGVLYIIDKHAAHERIIYESLKKGKKEGGSQLLLMPLSVNLAPDESMALSENGEYLENIGYVFEEFGSNTYLIRGVPAEIDMSVAAETFIYLAGQIAKAGGKAIGDIFDRALYTAACKAAVKAGTKTSMLSSTMIADTLFSNDAVLYCPHGRPVILEFTKAKLDRMFSRT